MANSTNSQITDQYSDHLTRFYNSLEDTVPTVTVAGRDQIQDDLFGHIMSKVECMVGPVSEKERTLFEDIVGGVAEELSGHIAVPLYEHVWSPYEVGDLIDMDGFPHRVEKIEETTKPDSGEICIHITLAPSALLNLMNIDIHMDQDLSVEPEALSSDLIAPRPKYGWRG